MTMKSPRRLIALDFDNVAYRINDPDAHYRNCLETAISVAMEHTNEAYSEEALKKIILNSWTRYGDAMRDVAALPECVAKGVTGVHLDAAYGERLDVTSYAVLAPGVASLIPQLIAAGKHSGLSVAIVSHSTASFITRTMRGIGLDPDMFGGRIYGLDTCNRLRKDDSKGRVYHFLKEAFNLSSTMDITLVDDEEPNITAARLHGVGTFHVEWCEEGWTAGPYGVANTETALRILYSEIAPRPALKAPGADASAQPLGLVR